MTIDPASLIERKGRVFRFGDYPGQRFSLTRSEFEAANAGLAEVPVGFDPIGRRHYTGKSNAFDGMLGSAANFAADDSEISADFRLAPLLHAAIEKEGLKMSAVFNRSTKRLKQIDFTDSPIVEDAALFADAEDVAIFADFPEVPAGSEAMQDLEDDEEVLSKEDLAQHMHEVIAAGFPGLCDPEHMSKHAAFCKGDNGPNHLIAMHDFCVHHGATCSGMGHDKHAKFAHEGDYPVAIDEEIETETPDNSALIARLDALEETNKQQARQLKAERDRRIAGESASFANDNAAVLPPTSKPLFAGLYSLLSDLPEDSGVVEFAYGKDQSFKGSALDLLKQAVGQLKPHGLGVEKTLNKETPKPKEVPGVVVFANDEAEAPSPKAPTPAGATPTAERLAYLNSLNN